MTHRPRSGVLLPAVAALALALGACSSDGSPDGAGDAAAPSSSAAESTASAAPAPEGPFGDGCAAVPVEGEGSVAGMADDPVATAAASNPALSALVQAVQAASLVETFNTTPDITVLAPANPAFEALPADQLAALLGDTAQLTAVLTHHVIPGRLGPAELAGTHTTLNNDQITVEGSGTDLTVAADATVLGQAEATVLCGNLQTANATVYVIDQVLAPAEQ
ncbi:fasciclin domain-containing protein [Blastococcus xanthinilyticus]|uniref:Putative surface protein with fasciclin (FAS1) repeats n=1 Tax=Blastococcus xanthinilyticus TaxID=1564164 RepID=A0A5S5CW07_9ACTN|nr:fasciclin domain-containing protein [Blastococcus xanthinilyticus]TYP87913.1 putative surface protein with fasciclin (FAS1) repeats [Blastococcus xanthinilyticus]